MLVMFLQRDWSVFHYLNNNGTYKKMTWILQNFPNLKKVVVTPSTHKTDKLYEADDLAYENDSFDIWKSI